VVALEKGLTLTPRGSVLGGNLVRQDAPRIAKYVAFWLPLLLAKFWFDLQVLVTTVTTSSRITSFDSLVYRWGFTGSGIDQVWIAICKYMRG